MPFKPKISVIIPIYNSEQYLPKMLDSVLCQDFKEFELLCIDDGSVDSSGKICDDYSANDSRIRIIHKKNSGVAAARRTGFQQISGKYFIFLDSDDYLEPNALGLLYNKAETENSDITMCSVKFQYADKKFISNIYNYESAFHYLNAMLNDEMPIALWNKLIKTDFCKQNDISFISNINIGEDAIFTTKLFSNNPKISIIKQALYTYDCRISNSAINSLKFNKKKLDEYLISLKIITNILINKNVYDSGILDKKKAMAKILVIESGLYNKDEILYLFYKETKRYIRKEYKLDFAIQLVLLKFGFLTLARLFGKYKRLFIDKFR